MALQVVGAGLGRTGTMTLKAALEQMGFGPCHHMIEVIHHPEQDATWLAAVNGEPVDWNSFLAIYRSSVDFPSCHFYKELSARYPKAKVILSRRDPKKWYASISKTIFEVTQNIERNGDDQTRDTHSQLLMRLMEETFQNRYDEEHVIAAYEHHNAEVLRVIPKERLLVFGPEQGWAPLCQFLEVPIPSTAFPFTNTTAEFQARVAARRKQEAEKQA
jgi:hypothetical protein